MMRFEVVGDIIFANDFWECECKEMFIHRKSEEMFCFTCGYDEGDCPDSRITELLIYYPHVLTVEERKEAIDFLISLVPEQKITKPENLIFLKGA